MPNLKYDVYNSPIDPRTGTPEFFNLSKKNRVPAIDWSEYRRTMSQTAPVNQAVGLNFVPYGGMKDIDKRLTSYDIMNDIPEGRAQAQTGIELIGKALGQSVNEMVLGTLESAGYILDAPGIASSLSGNEQEFDNWWSKFWRESKEHIDNKYIPIYQTKAAQEGSLLDATALASGAKNIATSLSLMIPAIGVARGVNIAGKLVGMGAKSLAVSEAVAAGFASKSAEATMGAQQYLKQYSEQNKTDLMKKYEASAIEEINKLPMVMPPNEYGFSPYTQEQRLVDEKRIIDRYKAQVDQEANKMAIDGANKVFKAYAALAVVDALQFLPIFKGAGDALSGLRGGKALEVGLQMGSETVEEFYQSGMQAEAYGSIKAGEDMFGAGFSERFDEYLKSNEMKQSVFWSTLGGGVFAAAAPIAKNVLDAYTDFDIWKNQAKRTGNVEAFAKLTSAAKEDLIYKYAKRNKLDGLVNEMSTLESTLEDQDWATLGMTKDEGASMIKSMKEDVSFIQQEKQKLDTDPRFTNKNEAKLDFLRTKLTSKNNSKIIKSSTDEIKSLYSEIEKDGELSSDLLGIKKIQDNINALTYLKKNLNKIPSLKSNSELRSKIEKDADIKLAILKESLDQRKQSYVAENPGTDFATILKTSKDDVISKKNESLAELVTVQNSVIKPKLQAYENIEKIKTADEELKAKREAEEKKNTKESIQNASTPEDINDIAESVNEENVDIVAAETNKKAKEEEIGASDKPDLRYIDRPNLFVKEMQDLEGHVMAVYDGVLNEEIDAELSLIIMSENAEEFVKNYQSLYEAGKRFPNKAKLFDIIQEFYENIAKSKQDIDANSFVKTDEDVEPSEYTEPVDEEISLFPEKPTKSSDIGFIHSDEKQSTVPSPSRATIREYTLTKGNIKVVNGVPEIDMVGKTMPIDWDYVNDPFNLLSGSEIYFVVNLDDTTGKTKTSYHKDLKGEDFINKSQILIAQRDKDGKEHIVNALPIHSPSDASEDNLRLKDLRNEIWSAVKASNQRSGIFNSGIKTKVTKKYSGRLLTSKAKNKPHDVLASGQPLIFGIAKTINGVTKIDAGKNVSAEYSGIVVDSKNAGGVFMLIRGANGRIVPARCFTQELTKFPQLLSQAKALLESTNAENWAANRELLKKIVYLDYNYNAKTDSFTVYSKDGRVDTYTKDKLDDLLRGKIVQISSSEINRGDYNMRISQEGRLKVDIVPQKNIVNTNFEFSLDYNKPNEEKEPVFVLPKEADDIVGDTIDNQPVVLTIEPRESIIHSEEISTSNDFDSLEDFENPLGQLLRIVPKKTASNRDFYQKWDELKETKWFKDRFDESLIDVDKFRDGLINISKNGGIQAWGMFKNAIAYISGAAQTGTTYHEALHVVFHLYLNQSQQNSLLKEGSKKYGIDINNSITIEEKIADEFMEYVMTEESSAATLGSKIKDFFKHLYQLIKSKLTNDVNINDVFYRAQHGMYKNKPFSRNVDAFKATRYRDKDFRTPYEEERRSVALADFMRKALDAYIESNPEYKSMSRREVLDRMTAKSKSGKDIKGIDLLALNARASIIASFKGNESISDEQKRNIALMLNKFIKLDENGNVVFEYLGRKSLLQFARTEGLRIKTKTKEISSSIDSAEGEPLMEFFEEESQNEGWQIKSEQLSGKESLSNEVRKELSYIPKLDKSGVEIVDDLGFTVYQDFNTVYADIQRELAGVNDSEEMINKLNQIVVVKPYLAKLVEKVSSDNLFKTKMFVNFNRSHVDYKIVIQTKDRETGSTEYRVLSSNRMGIKNILVDEWKDNSTDSLFNKTVNDKGEFIQENLDILNKAWSVISSRMKSKDQYDSKDLNDLSRILRYVGITITQEDLELLNKSYQTESGYIVNGRVKVNELKSDLDKIISKFISGVNPFGATSLETEAINNVAKIISKFRFELMESSFKNAENNTVYAHQVPSFLSRAIGQFAGKNAVDKIKWYQDTPFYRNSPWLKELLELESRNNFEYVEIDAIKYDRTEKGVRYTSMSEKDFENTAINMYFNNGASDYVYYKFPVVSDAPKMPFIKFRRYSTKDVVNKLFEVYKQEVARIEQIKARQAAREELIKQGLSIPDELKEIKNFDGEKSRRFLFLQFLNTGHARKAVGSGNDIAIKKAIEDYLNEQSAADFDRLNKLGVYGKDVNGVSNYDDRIAKKWGNTEAFHKDYFFNSFLANTQMMSLFSGDPAFYKPDKSAQSIYSRTVDYQKRNKQNVSPKTTMDINAVFELTEDQSASEGKPMLQVGHQYNSIYIKDLEIESNHAEEIYETLTASGMEESIAADIAGAYGYNSSSKINVTDAQAYITLPRYREIMIGLGRWTKDLQDIYPKLLSGTASGSELMTVLQPIKPFYFGHTKVGNLIIPTQNKNSEYLLLPQLVKGSKDLTKLYKYMINNNISSANFNSAVKAGEFGAQKLEDIEKASIHVLNNEDYGLQQETPEHHIDSRSLFGSQIRKLILSDINDDALFNIDGNQFTKKELVDLYQQIISEDLKSDFESIESNFNNIDSIHDILLSEILDRDLGEEREIAIKIKKRLNKETGESEEQFNLPLYHPYHAKSNESLLNSVFKNNVTKQKIKGGAFVQVSSFGFSNELNLVMDGERLVGAEVMLPWWSKKFFEPLLDSNGQLDINKVPQNLREMIGYRIPTEDKYSMLPLVVKGFLPASAGGAVMLPMEITTISGSDFDIDKMYIMMPEFEMFEKYNIDEAWKAFYEENPEIVSKIDEAKENSFKLAISNAVNEGLNYEEIQTNLDNIKDKYFQDLKASGVRNYDFVDGVKNSFSSWFKEAKDEFLIKRGIKKTDYKYQNDMSSQSKQARNNAKIDIIRAILTHQDTFSKIIKPGGFPTLESLAKKVLGLEGKSDEMLPIALPSTQTELFKRNMTGKQLIGIFANHNTSHAVMQYTNVELADSIVSFDGLSLKSLHEVKNQNGDFISRNVAEWLAAVVDNAKNPLSSFINVNTYTADVAALMTRLGYPLETVVAFMSQPVLKEFSRLYFNYGADKQAEAKANSELIKAFFVNGAAQSDGNNFNTQDLLENIKSKELFTKSQFEVFNAFALIKEQATALADLVRATRADTKGAGPTLSENENLIQLRKDVLLSTHLMGHEELLDGTVYPMENAFMTYGISKPTELLSQYFPWFSPAFTNIKQRIAKSIKAKTLTVKQIEQINYELLGFIATGFDFFNGSDKTEIINNMSKKIKSFKEKYPQKYQENFFVNKLVFKKDEAKQYLPERVQFKNTGSLTELDKQQIKEHWMSLMEDSDLAVDKEFNTFAKDLVKYAFYTAGFQLTPNSFSHLVPVEFYSNLVDEDGQSFNDYLIASIKEADNEDAFNEFIDQFFRNNSDDLSFVPSVDSQKFENITGAITRINGVPSFFKVNAKDKNLRRDFIVGTSNNGKAFAFSPFVSFREKGVVYLFQNMSRSATEATYVLTGKLGIPNAALEYEKNEFYLDSVIPSNNPFKGKLTRASIIEQANIKEDVEEDEGNVTEPLKPEVKISDFMSEEKTDSDVYTEITESLRSKLIDQINSDESLIEYLDTTVANINKMNIEELGELYKKFCNR